MATTEILTQPSWDEGRGFELLSRHAPFGMMMIDGKGRCTYLNPKFTELFGYALIDLPDRDTWFKKAFPGDEVRARLMEAWSEEVGSLEPGERASRIITTVCKDGREKTASTILVSLGGGEVLVTFEDITDRLRTEAELRNTNEKLHAIVMASPLAILCLDPDKRVVIWNQAAERMFGWKAHEVIGRPYPLAPPGSEERFQTIVSTGLRGESVTGLELHQQAKDRRPLHVSLSAAPVYDSQGVVMGIMVVMADITEHKRTEELLQESEAKYRGIIEESLVGAYIVQDGAFRYVNRRFCEIHGYSYEELVDVKSPPDLVYPEDRPLVEENMRRRLKKEIDQVQYEFRAVRKDGEIITVKVIGGALDYKGRPAAVGTLLDVTREKALEQQLVQAQKMEAIGTLAGGVAHDFNNILTAIIGYSNLLQMKMDPDDPRRVYVDHVLASSQTAVQLTHSLLAFSRKQVIELRPQKINAIVKGVEKLLSRLLTEDIEIRLALSKEDMTVLADVTQMDQVLMNLATNARDAMPGGGRLVISVLPKTMDHHFIRTHGYGKQGGYAVLSVEDTGTGMDEKTIKKIFDPFFTTKEVGKGTGLGLAIVYGIVKQHNGYIDVNSEPGKGTTFNIYLPLVHRTVEEEKLSPLAVKGGSETILVAEDKLEVRKLTREVLENGGYCVIEAPDGEGAVKAFLEHMDQVDLLLLDVVMPKMNGKEVYDRLKEVRPHLKVLFMSGYTSDILLRKGVYDASSDYIAKPVPPLELLAKVREVLDR